MTSATLFREGTDLDGLLAELDSEFPGQVRVLEVTHTREGGVFGFFARPRVGVQFALTGNGAPAATPDSDPVGDLAGEPAGVIDGSTDPLDALIAAAEIVETGQAQAVSPEAVTDDRAETGNVEFARMLLDIAARKAAERGVELPAAQAARATAPLGTIAPAVEPAIGTIDDAAAPSATTPSATTPSATTPRTAMTATTTDATTVAATEAAKVAKPVKARAGKAAAKATAKAGANATAKAKTTAKAGANATAKTAAKAAAGATAQTAAKTTVKSTAATDTAAPAATTKTAAGTKTSTATGTKTKAGRGTARTKGAITQATVPASVQTSVPVTVLAGKAVAAAAAKTVVTAAVPTAPAGSAPTPVDLPDLGASAVAPSPQPAPAATSSAVPEARTTGLSETDERLALRRRLAELGVPFERIPTDPPHRYAAVEQLVGQLREAAALPQGGEQIVVVAGPSAQVARTAALVIKRMALRTEQVWSYRCSVAGVPAEREIRDVGQAAAIAQTARHGADARTQSTLVVVGLDEFDSYGDDEPLGPPAASIIAALAPETFWLHVDARRKTSDTAEIVRELGTPTALVVTGAARTSSPASVWQLDIPIALVDGRRSTRTGWAALMLEKLAGTAA